ncbi:hypothetical protein J4X32_11275 [Escherichia coli]
MHRIDTKTAQKDKFGAGKNGFTRGNPQTGTPATDLDDDYFDMLQEELCSVVEASGASLEKGRHDQLLTALHALLLSRKNPFGDIKSDGTVETALENLGLGASAFGLKNVVSFTTSQVVQWTVPDILKQGRKCYVVVIGGGASGAYGSATSGGTGGSAGGRSEKIVDLTGVDAVTVTVGAGGEPVTTNNTGGNAGDTSSFGTYLSATGAPTTNLFSSQPGGTGVGGDVNINGFPGAPATVGSTDGKRTGGNGGGPGGGVGRHSAAQQGAESERNAQSPGSGGAGLAYYSGLTGSTGRGADGAVYIYW